MDLSPRPSMRLVRDSIAYCAEHLPQWNAISISGYHIREAGATAVQELAFTLYDGLTYVQEAVEAGLSIDAFAPRLSFFFDVHSDFFEEIAKFRAARRIWAREIERRSSAQPAVAALAHPCPDRWSLPDSAAAVQQYCPGGSAGAGCVRGHAIVTYECAGRGARPANGRGGTDGPAYPADYRARDRVDGYD